MTNRTFMSAAAIALIIFGAPAFAQVSQNMPGMSMGGMSNDSTPAPKAGSTTDKPSPTDGAKKSMSVQGMDMSNTSMSGHGKRGCGMHMTRTSMSMDKSNAHTRSDLEPRHFQMTHPGGTGSR